MHNLNKVNSKFSKPEVRRKYVEKKLVKVKKKKRKKSDGKKEKCVRTGL